MTPTEVRIKTLHTGHWPLAAINKVPVMTGWPDFIPTDADIYRWAQVWPDAQNTGVNNKKTPFIDVDVRNAEAADAIRWIIKGYVADDCAFLIRTGYAPKFSIPLQTYDRPFAKIVTPKFAETLGDGKEILHAVEFRCDGCQTIIHGTHPDTGRPFVWENGRALWDVQYKDLPCIDEAVALMMCEEITAYLFKIATQLNWKEKKPKDRPLTTNIPGQLRCNPQPGQRVVVGSHGGSVSARLRGLIESVAKASEGERNGLLFWASNRLHDMATLGEVTKTEFSQACNELIQAATAAGLSRIEAQRTIASAMRQG
jgi:Bifunctional DNA primase/polymerase, N-terminal